VIVEETATARKQFAALPLPIKERVRRIYERLARWPEVSGVKPLTGDLAGNYRIRTGDYRLVFKIDGERVIVWKIGDRKDVYLD
jgi:mRNA interferase RelE/StbE